MGLHGLTGGHFHMQDKCFLSIRKVVNMKTNVAAGEKYTNKGHGPENL